MLIELQTAIAQKNTNTEGHFRAHFLGTTSGRRFDADIKNKELANILAFYFERARDTGYSISQVNRKRRGRLKNSSGKGWNLSRRVPATSRSSTVALFSMGRLLANPKLGLCTTTRSS